MNLNVLKGMLIILVIADHNNFTRSLMPGFFLGLTFHVVGFMTIPFLKAPEPVFTRRFAHYAFRLYWPFLLLTCALWAVVTVMGSAPLSQRLPLLPLALYSGNANLLKEVTHMGLLWFLPSFITLVAVGNLIARSGRALQAAAWIALALAHVLIGALARSIENYLPLGVLPALYMLPLAFIGAALQRRWLDRVAAWPAVALTVAAYAAVKAVQMHWSLHNEVGFSTVADWRDPQAMLVNDLEAITGTLMLFQLARLNLGRLLNAAGNYSMQMYLLHAFVALAVYACAVRLAPGLPVSVLFAGSLAATIGLTLLVSIGVMRWDLLRRLVFPRNPGELAWFAKPKPVVQSPPAA